MSGITNEANQPLLPLPVQAAPAEDPQLAACIALIAADPELAASLAEHQCEQPFFEALGAAMRARGIELCDESLGTTSSRRPPAPRMRLSHWPLSARRGWRAIALECGAYGAELVWACGAVMDAPFDEQQVMELRARPLNRLLSVSTPVTEALVTELAREALPLNGLIFHMSRCGSTLVAQALKAWRGVRVVSEPALLDSAILLGRAGRDPHRLLLRAAVAALSQPSDDDSAVVLKLEAWHALVLRDIVSSFDAPWLFVYRNPVEVLASHRREPGKHTVPGMLPDAWLPPAAQGGQLALEQHAACVLGSVCAAVVPHARRENLLNYDELPQAVATRVAGHFRLDPFRLDEARLAQTGTRHAKHPCEEFVVDVEAKRAVADRGIYEYIGRWIEPHYRALEEMRTVVRHLRLPFACNLAGLRADLAGIAPQGWEAHFNTQYYRGDWSGIALRAQAHGRSPLYAEPSLGAFVDTEAMRRCRHVTEFLRQFECGIESVRFLRLAPGAEIREHRDFGLRFEEGVVRLHVPVYTNPDVEFILGSETLSLGAGECWYLNFDLPHRIVNGGSEDRVHLVVDARVNAWVEELFSRLCAGQTQSILDSSDDKS